MKTRNVYHENGCANRSEYLTELANENGVDPAVVFMLADLYGPNEDFDGLITAVEDYAVM